MKTILLILALAAIAYSGQIYSWSDANALNFQTNGSPSITLYFQLENPITSLSFLRIALPFTLSDSWRGAATLYRASSRCADLPTETFSSTAKKGDGNAAYVSFSTTILAKTPYALTLELGSQTGLAVGLSSIIGLSSVTSDDANYITIDTNPTFADIEWVSESSNAMVISLISDDPDKANVNSGHTVRFSFTPTSTNYIGGATVRIIIEQSDFTITSAEWDSTNETVAIPATWTEKAQISKNSLSINIPTAPPANQKIGFKLSVTNPNKIKNSKLTVRLFRRYTGQLVEEGSDNALIKSVFAATTLNTSSIETAYGAPTTSGALKYFYGITGSASWYQTFRFNFKLTAVPTGFISTLTLNLGGSKGTIMLSSLLHNLNAGRKADCKVITNDLVCENVILSVKDYFIAIKVKLLDAAEAPAEPAPPADFGKLKITMKNPDDTPIDSSSNTLLSTVALQSITFQKLDATSAGNKVETSAGALNVIASSAAGTISYAFKPGTDTPIVTMWGSSPSNPGFEFIFNRFIGFNTNFVFSGTLSKTAADGTGPAAITSTSLNRHSNTTVENKYFRVRAALNVTTEITSFVTTEYLLVNLGGYQIIRGPSLRADEGAFEVFVGFGLGIADANTAPTSYNKYHFYSNSFIVPSGTPFTSIATQLVGAHVGDATAGRAAYLLRVYGSLASAETTGMSKFAIFFSNIAPYDLNATNETVQCFASHGTGTTQPSCVFVPGASASPDHSSSAAPSATREAIISYHRIEITWTNLTTATTGAPFQILIPVALTTVTAVSEMVDPYMATIDANNTITNFGRGRSGAPSPLVAGSGPFQAGSPLASIATLTFKLESTDRIGASVGSRTLRLSSSNAAITGIDATKANVVTLTGTNPWVVNSGVQYCASWNFYGNATSFTNSLAASASEEKCLAYALPIPTATPTTSTVPTSSATRWCIFCPIGIAVAGSATAPGTAVVTISNYTVWNGGSSWGANALAGTSPAYGCVYAGSDSASEAVACDDSLETAVTGNISSLSFSPNTMVGGSISNRITINFTLTNAISKAPTTVAAGTEVRFIIRQNDTLFVKDTSSACSAVLGAATVSCSFSPQTADHADETVSTRLPSIVSVANVPSTPFTTVSIILDGINPSVSTVSTVSVQVSTRVVYSNSDNSKSLNLLLELSNQTNFTISAAPAALPVPELSGIRYSNPVRGARGTLKIAFKPTGTRFVQAREQFQILFGNTNIGATSNNTQASLLCEVYDSKDVPIEHFSTCVISAESITLTAKVDVPNTVGAYVLLRGFTTANFNSTSLGAKLLSPGGSAIQTTATPANNTYFIDSLENQATALGDVAVLRYANHIGGSSILQFTLTNRNSSINSASRILISFPNYFSPKLTHNMLQVQLNGKPTFFTIPEDRLLQISPNAVVAKDAVVVIRILGISLPRIATAGQFWIAIDNDSSNLNGFIQGGYITDSTLADPASTIPALAVYNLTFWTGANAAIPQIRTPASINFTLLTRVSITKGNVISLAFPDSWSGLLATSPSITCIAQAGAHTLGVATNATTSVATFGLVAGNTIKLNVTVDIANNSQVNISCSNVRMPDDQFVGDCVSQTPTISVFDGPAEANLVTRSSPTTHHIPRTVALTRATNLIYLNWPAEPIKLPQGTTQVRASSVRDEAFVRLPSGASPFARQISLKITSAPEGVTLIDSTGVANVGETQLLVGLQASSTAALGTAPILFERTETALGGATVANMYAAPPALFVEVTTSKADVQASIKDVSVPVGGYSYPIPYTSTYAPSTDVVYTVGGDSAVLLFNAAGAQSNTATLPAGKKEFALIVQVQSTAAVGAKMAVFVNASSTSNPAFTVSPANISIVAANPLTESPTIALTHDPLSTQSNQQQQVVAVKIGTTNVSNTNIPPVTLYWACALTSLSINRDLVFVRQALSGAPVPYPGESFGTKFISAPGATDTALVERLLANSNYTCRFWAVNQGNQTASNTTTIKTPSNNGKVGRIFVEYDADKFTDPAALIGSTLCWMSTFLTAPPQLIRALSGQICGQSRGSWNPEYLRYNISSTASVVVVPIYFLTNNAVMDDRLYTDVVGKLLPANTAARTAVPSINRLYSPVPINTTAPVLPEPTVLNGTSSSPVTVTFKAPGENNISIAYVGVWTWTNTSTPPTWASFNPYNPNNTLVAAAATYFNGTTFAPQTISLNITFVTGTTYALFYTGTCENPSEQGGDCVGPIMGPIIVTNTGSNPAPVDQGTGSTSDSRVLTFSLSFLVALLLSIFI